VYRNIYFNKPSGSLPGTFIRVSVPNNSDVECRLNRDFSAFDGPTTHHYLSAMDDIVIRTRNFNEQLLSNWATIIKLLEEPQEQEPPDGETIH